jgi:predicted nucleic acid-binding protein
MVTAVDTSVLLDALLDDAQNGSASMAALQLAAAQGQLAGEMYRSFLKRGGKRGRVVPDFLIAAHAQVLADRFLARDRGHYRDYFVQLPLWDPSRPEGF